VTEPDEVADVIAAARKLINAVGFDVNGINGRGGNGGLTSTETVRASDELRLAIYRLERARTAQ
jgi:hypothetical protein